LPRNPVYVMNGAAGDREGQGHGWIEPAPSWSYTHNSVARCASEMFFRFFSFFVFRFLV
jgi:hypothetical protein